MGKRLSIIFAVLVCVCSMGLIAAAPVGGQAHAAAGSSLQAQDVQDEGTDLQPQAVKKYGLWVGGKQVTSKNAKNVFGDKRKSVSYNASTNTLTLNNAKISSAKKTKAGDKTYLYGIISQQNRGLSIVLKGASTVSVPGKATSQSYALYAFNTQENKTGDILIEGKGSLKLQAGKAVSFSRGVSCNNLNIKGSAQVTALGGPADKFGKNGGGYDTGSYGVYSKGSVGLFGTVKLVAQGKNKAMNTAPTFGFGYTPQVKAGDSAKKIKVNKKSPAKSVYKRYKYVSISKAKVTPSEKPEKLTITSIESRAGGFYVVWSEPSKNCTGYQLQVSADKSFPSGSTGTYSTDNKNYHAATVPDLASNTVYYVRVRGVNKTSSKTYYGPWSAVSSVMVK